jgi:hypothetical protein
MTPGETAAAQADWPGRSILPLASDRLTLVMFVHPECPCSRASLGELQQLLTTCKNHLAVQIFFFKPINQSENWVHTDLWNDAKSISGAEVRIDLDGKFAELFGAKTSGQVFIYRPDGKLEFSGGMTDGRGHFGDNVGLDAAIAVTHGDISGDSAAVTSSVYGCALASLSLPSQKVQKSLVSKP